MNQNIENFTPKRPSTVKRMERQRRSEQLKNFRGVLVGIVVAVVLWVAVGLILIGFGAGF